MFGITKTHCQYVNVGREEGMSLGVIKVLMRCLQHFGRDTIMNQKCILELREARNVNVRSLYKVDQVKGKTPCFLPINIKEEMKQ